MKFTDHSANDLAHVAAALEDGRLTPPFSAIGLSRLGISNVEALVRELNELLALGFQSAQIAVLLGVVANERIASARSVPKLELVVTGPDLGEQARDTAIVVEQLFGEAKASVLLVGFALFDGKTIFKRFAEQLDAIASLEGTLCLDISRRGTDTTKDADLIARYAHEFRNMHWPGNRLPRVFYDPRGLAVEPKRRAVLHAKCIVVDAETALVTSANPTPAAYTKNIELGVVVRGGTIPGQIASHFHSMIERRLLRRLDLPSQ